MILTSLRLLIEYALHKNEEQKFEVEFDWKALMLNSNEIQLTPSFVKQIHSLWNEKPVQDAYLHKSEIAQLPDNVDYFMSRLDIVTKPDYEPTFEDYIRVRERTTGYYTERITALMGDYGEYMFEFTDVGGQRSERKKWMKIIHEHLHAVLFVVAISEYDKKCFEDNETYRIHEALRLFENVIEQKFFDNKSTLLFLNKYDIFRDKIGTVPITISFPNFPNDKDPKGLQDVTEFLVGQFKAIEQKFKIKTHIHLTTALDTGHINKLFNDITMDLVQNNIKNNFM